MRHACRQLKPSLQSCQTHALLGHLVLHKLSSHSKLGCCRKSDLLAELESLSQGHSDALSTHHTGGSPPRDCSHTSAAWSALAILLLLLQRLQLGLPSKQGPQLLQFSVPRRSLTVSGFPVTFVATRCGHRMCDSQQTPQEVMLYDKCAVEPSLLGEPAGGCEMAR